MEHEIKFDENTTKLIRAFRAKVAEGKPGTRPVLLAYAYLKDKPYASLETKINEDHECFGSGKFTFLEYMSLRIFGEISLAVKETKIEYSTERKDVYNWLLEKYNSAEAAEEKAA